MRQIEDVTPDEILSFWFPDGIGEAGEDEIGAFFKSRMHGGMDEAIICDYAELSVAAAEGHLDHWAETADGRLALILVLDQFPRSLWRDTPKAFGQDMKATRLALEGIANGHYESLPYIVQRQFYIICISHCEGPDHDERMALCRRLNEAFREIALGHQQAMVDSAVAQVERVSGIIARFGRHPHRNPIYGRISTPAERAYIETGDFPHLPRKD